MTPVGLVCMAYGSPATLDDLLPYYTHIRGGKVPSPDQVAELRERYQRIGGQSPLAEITQRQAMGVARALQADDLDVRAYVGMKHAPPFITDVIARMAADGIRHAVGMALAPHYSKISVASYFATAEEAASRHEIRLTCIQSWHDLPGFITTLVNRVRAAQTALPDAAGAPVVFTAHSLPERILSWHDPYPVQLARTCELVAAQAGLRDWRFAYQSASHTGEPWLGPDLLEALDQIREEGHTSVVICPVGFVADHLEVLYDIDIEASAHADELGIRLVRAPTAGEGADFLRALADLLRPHVREAALA
jgi:protoporphyrin/coproporphyrin ferrochelatase